MHPLVAKQFHYTIGDISDALCGKTGVTSWDMDFEDYFMQMIDAGANDMHNDSLVYFNADNVYAMWEDGTKYNYPNGDLPLELHDWIYLNEIIEFFATYFPDGQGYWDVPIHVAW